MRTTIHCLSVAVFSPSFAQRNRLRPLRRDSVMALPKQTDLGGEAAWVGGNRAIDNCDNKSLLYCYALRRLQALAKVTHKADPTQLVNINFEAMMVAYESMAPNEALHYDHAVLRGLYAKYTGNLTAQQKERATTWESSKAGDYVYARIRQALQTSWRSIPAVAFGDSGSCNIFKRNKPSMISYCQQWLQRPVGDFKDYIHIGWDIDDWTNAFEKDKD